MRLSGAGDELREQARQQRATAEERRRDRALEAAGFLRPLGDVRPVPGGATTDRPVGLREAEFAVTPLVERRAADAQALAKLDDSHGIADHAGSVSNVLTRSKECEHNTYMEKPQFKVRKTIAQHLGDDHWMTMDEDGQIAEFPTAERVVKALKCRDAGAAKKGDSTATLIEWVDVPEGFTPPEVA